MALVVNRTKGLTYPYEKDVRRSVHTPDFPNTEWLVNPDLSEVEGWPTRYWDIQGDLVVLVDQATRDARDQEIVDVRVADAITAAKNEYDQQQILRAVVLTIIDEINVLRAQHSLPPRTPAQARTAVRNKLDGGV